jgi:adenylate kinase family enzyme
MSARSAIILLGPHGSGKSTIAKQLKRNVNVGIIESGAMLQA